MNEQWFFFFQAEDGIRDRSPSRGLGDVYKRQVHGDLSEQIKIKEKQPMEQIEETLKNSRETSRQAEELISNVTKTTSESMKRIEETMASIKRTLEGCKETEKAFKKYDELWTQVFQVSLANIGRGLGPPMHLQKPSSEDNTPKILGDAKVLLEELRDKKRIVFLTGAGISAASGIPTFRGEGGFWKRGEDTLKCQEVLTKAYFDDHSDITWQWHHEFRTLLVKAKPNASHFCIAQLHRALVKGGRAFSLITQNIDTLHLQALKSLNNAAEYSELKDSVFEIHGSMDFMRCDEHCQKKFYASPPSDVEKTFVPICPDCGKRARPHTLFFDEGYKEELYRSDTAYEHASKMDCLVVIGTALETNMGARIVEEAIKNKVLIIEINPNPVIECGNVRRLVGTSDLYLTDLISSFMGYDLSLIHI
eukprot:TRINITY_DN9126_c0_g1_i1.p1 TRINITY_DN9126_c0_g1~~TRINITY_DN9126_c0_g1_i1.p1  ORF type:complete len:421 (+),score=63.44 TRINITY_DN9126_c0_g1_i1:39-1301(+)